MTRILIAGLIAALVAPGPAALPAPTGPPAPTDPTASTAVVPVTPRFDPTEAIRRLGDRRSCAWIKDGVLHAIVRVDAEVDGVLLLAAVQEPLEQLEDPTLWGGAFAIERADEAVMSCGFGVRCGGTLERMYDTPPIRGAAARRAPAVADPLGGAITTHHLGTATLGAARAVSVYLPPGVEPDSIGQVLFLADGQGIGPIASHVEPLVVSGAIRPTAIVGIASDVGGNEPATDGRAQEYLTGFTEFVDGADAGRFDRHWRFFTEEVPQWVRTELGITVAPCDRIVAGSSNGGAFAATVAARAPDGFGASIVLSSGWLLVPEAFEARTEVPCGHRIFFSAGTHEPRFLRQTKAAYAAAVEAGYRATFDERVGGHDPLIWREQIVAGLQWLERTRG